jgi:hypothetical protein
MTYTQPKPVPKESAEQRAVIRWWASYCRTKGLDERLLFASWNGAHLAGDSTRRAIKMRLMKMQGLRPGVPDLFLALPKRDRYSLREYNVWLFAGLFIELKRTKGSTTSPEQHEYINLLRKQGYNCVIAYGADEAIRAIRGYVEG